MTARLLLDVQMKALDRVTVLKPVGWLTSDSCGELERRLELAVGHGCKRFVLDLSSTHFADHSGPAALAAWGGELHGLGGCLTLAAPSGSALRAIVASRLSKLLAVCDSVGEAVELARRRTASGRWKPVAN